MTLEELISRQQITDLGVAYANSAGAHDWAAYEAVFTPDAVVDYTSAGGIAGTPAEAAKWLAATLSIFDLSFFQPTNTEIRFESADRATVLSLFNTVMRIPGADGAAPTYLRAGGHYDDVVVTVDGVWKIASRTERFAFAQM